MLVSEVQPPPAVTPPPPSDAEIMDTLKMISDLERAVAYRAVLLAENAKLLAKCEDYEQELRKIMRGGHGSWHLARQALVRNGAKVED